MSPLYSGLMASALTVVWLSPSFADDPDPKNWTGQLVVGKKPNRDIKFGDNSSGKEIYFEFRGAYPQKVREDRGGWLRLFDGHKEGWADKDDFILCKDAVSYFSGRIDANEKDAFSWEMRASVWYSRGDFDSAIKDNTECIRLNPKDETAFIRRGCAWDMKNDYDRAIKDFDEAIRLDPKNTLAFINRGASWCNKSDYDRAIKDYDEAIRLDPKFASAFFNRGLAWSDKCDFDRAIKDYDEAIRLDPMDAIAFYSRGLVLCKKKDFDRAIKDFDEAIRLDPKNVHAFYNRGNAWYSKNDFDRAIQDFDEAIRFDPKYALAFYGRAVLWNHKKNYDREIQDYDEAIRLEPKFAWAKYNRAITLMIRRRPESVDGFRAVLDLEGFKGELSTYSVINGHLAARRVGNGEAAKSFLADSKGKLAEAWPSPLVQFLRGDLDEAGVTKLATETDKQIETRHVLGQVAALNGKKDEALAHFRWVKEKGNPTMVPFMLAVAELEELERGKK